MKSQQNTSDRALGSNLKMPNSVDFSTKDLYVGIDVHKERWQVAVYYEGLILSNISIEANFQKLINHLSKRYGNAQFHCVYESCAWGFHLCRTLREAGMDCVIVNPADIPGTDKERKSKTDKVDARKLATHLASGLLHPIYVPTEKLQKQRGLIRLRKKIWGDLVRVKNRLRGELRFQGYIIPEKFDSPSWSNNFLLWIEQLAIRDEYMKETLLMMLDEIKALRQLLLKAEKKLRDLMRSDDYRHNSDLLRTIPGIGPLTSMLFLLEVGDVRRFRSFDALNRYVGLCPDSHSSGEKLKNTGISSRSHSQIRSALVEASWQLIRRDVAMLNHYKDLQKRMKGQEAIIRIARKLLRRIRAVLLSDRIYVSGIDEMITAKELNAPNLPMPKPIGRPRKIFKVN